MRLMSMTDFVLELARLKQVKITKFINYANFIRQSPELWMFVPCKLVDGVWVAIPDKENHFIRKELEEYQEASDLCLFKGFEYVNKWYNTHLIAKDKITGESQFQLDNFKTIEDMIGIIELELTPAAQKQIGL